MYIPCLPTEGEHGGGAMRLIVPVCDYDWGKKDDNIGEIIIDAKNLPRQMIQSRIILQGEENQSKVLLR